MNTQQKKFIENLEDRLNNEEYFLSSKEGTSVNSLIIHYISDDNGRITGVKYDILYNPFEDTYPEHDPSETNSEKIAIALGNLLASFLLRKIDTSIIFNNKERKLAMYINEVFEFFTGKLKTKNFSCN